MMNAGGDSPDLADVYPYLFTCIDTMMPRWVNIGLSRRVEVRMRWQEELHDSLDLEEQRYVREGFNSERELAVYDLLSKGKTDITKGDIDKVKKVAQELMATVAKRRHEMGDLRDRASSQAQMKAAIIDRLLDGMPDGYSSEDIEARAEVIFQYVQGQLQSAALH